MDNKILIECLRSQAKALRTQAELLDNLANTIENDNKHITETPLYQDKNMCELPPSMKVDDVAKFMGIGRVNAYNLTHIKDFPKIKVGRKIIIPRDAFLKWINAQTANNI